MPGPSTESAAPVAGYPGSRAPHQTDLSSTPLLGPNTFGEMAIADEKKQQGRQFLPPSSSTAAPAGAPESAGAPGVSGGASPSAAGPGGGPGQAGVPDAQGILPNARPLYDKLMAAFPGSTIGGYRVDDYHEHDHGAMDYMTTDPTRARQVMQMAFDAGAPYVLWQQTQWNRDGTSSGMDPRPGGPTANHMDHVHIAPFTPAVSVQTPTRTSGRRRGFFPPDPPPHMDEDKKELWLEDLHNGINPTERYLPHKLRSKQARVHGRRILTQRELYAVDMPCDPTKDPSSGGCSTAAPAGAPGGGPAPPKVPSVPQPGGPSSGGPSMGPSGAPGVGGVGGPSAPVNYSPNAGVEQWRPQAEEALRRNGLPISMADQVLHQVQTESSGNPNAINLTDSNAQAGHPSQGLLQTIPSTFQTYRLPGDSSSITDPQANMDAAVNYALHTYGPTLMSDGGGLGSGHGY